MRKHILYCGTALLVAGAHFANTPMMWIGGGLITLSVVYHCVETYFVYK